MQQCPQTHMPQSVLITAVSTGLCGPLNLSLCCDCPHHWRHKRQHHIVHSAYTAQAQKRGPPQVLCISLQSAQAWNGPLNLSL